MQKKNIYQNILTYVQCTFTQNKQHKTQQTTKVYFSNICLLMNINLMMFTFCCLHTLQSLYLASVCTSKKNIFLRQVIVQRTHVPCHESKYVACGRAIVFLFCNKLHIQVSIYKYISLLQKMYLINTILREFDVYLPNKYKSHFQSTRADIIFESN